MKLFSSSFLCDVAHVLLIHISPLDLFKKIPFMSIRGNIQSNVTCSAGLYYCSRHIECLSFSHHHHHHHWYKLMHGDRATHKSSRCSAIKRTLFKCAQLLLNYNPAGFFFSTWANAYLIRSSSLCEPIVSCFRIIFLAIRWHWTLMSTRAVFCCSQPSLWTLCFELGFPSRSP